MTTTQDPQRHGIFFVLSSPSGGGKTTIYKSILNQMDNLAYSVSYTTRPARTHEVNGRDYHFVDPETFERYRQEGQFVEWAQVHGAWYATHKQTLFSVLDTGRDIMLDIDVQGAKQLQARMKNGVYIFIMPPSMAELERRLRARKSDTEQSIKVRLEIARQEMGHFLDYDFLVINDRLETAILEVMSIIRSERCRLDRLNLDRFRNMISETNG
ncbi:guanylate kinase [bacterium]|nr:guanylate kinase [bacterium]